MSLSPLITIKPSARLLQEQQGETDLAIIRRCQEEPGPESYGQLFRQFERLLHSIVHTFRRGRNVINGYDDLFSEAYIGLVGAADRYDLASGIAFTTFAVITIAGHICHYLRDKDWMVRPPRRLQEGALRAKKVSARLSQTLGREPSVYELADCCELTVEELQECMAIGSAHVPISIERSRSSPEGHEDWTVLESLGYEELGYSETERAYQVAPLLSRLPKRQREILALRYYNGLTQRQVAELIGISQMHVSRLEREALRSLRDWLS